MTRYRVLTILGLLGLASGCTQGPPPESDTSRELARLERELATEPRPQGAQSAPASAQKDLPPTSVVPEVVDIGNLSASGPAPTLSPPFVTAAQAAWKQIEEELPAGPARGNQGQFDSDLAGTRARLQELRRLARTDDDTSVHLLMTLVLIKDKERFQTMLLNQRLRVSVENDPELADLSQQRKACAAEVRGWLFSGSDPAPLRRAHCISEARAAAKFVGAGVG
jgi:hypothetical protein